jgi:hypothetical protein
MPRVSLHLPESDHKAMVTLVANGGVRREVDVIMDSDDVGEEIAAGEREVIKDQVGAIVCILDTRDRDIANLHHTSMSNISLHNRGKIIFLISLHKSSLNFKLPSLSSNKSLVNRAQSSPNRSFVGSLPIPLNQFPTD